MLCCLGAKIRKYRKSQAILTEGSSAKYLGILLSGKAQIIRIDYKGNRSIIMKLNPAEMMAEAFACSDLSFLPVEVIATEDSEVMLIDARRITSTCSNACEFHNLMIFNLLRAVASKNITLNQKIEITSKRNTREKLMTYLLMEAKKRNSSSFTIEYSRQELADYLEVERSGLSTEIGKLKADGIIDCDKNNFKIL